jgi:membrane-associated phospholipid phosphatase
MAVIGIVWKWVRLFAIQLALVGGAILAYFGVRGLTEGAIETANRNAERLLEVERFLGIDLELGIQARTLSSEWLTDLGNWVYIWLHWPVIAVTLIWLVIRKWDDYIQLRNAMFISGAIGLVIFFSLPVTPPRLFDPAYIDTVTERSHSYRVLQPPNLVNKYAAMPSLHFGWNLLVGITWWQLSRVWWQKVAAVVMPIAMAFATVMTANHWVADVLVGGVVALIGLALERRRRRWPWTRDPIDEGAAVPASTETSEKLATS